jgi:hypothetical protein
LSEKCESVVLVRVTNFPPLTALDTNAIMPIMGLYVARIYKNLASGKRLTYFVLRQNVWDYEEKRQKTKYVGYLGPKPVITLEKAQALCQKLGIGLIDLQNVKGLQIIDDLTVEGPFGERVSKS